MSTVVSKANFSLSVDTQNNLVAWQVRGNMSVEDAENARNKILSSIDKLDAGQVVLLVDNRKMQVDGRAIVFTPEVNQIWETTQKEVFPKLKKCAVLCSGVIMKMQMNRIAKVSGIDQVQQSFWNDDNDKMVAEAAGFLGLDIVPILADLEK